MEVVVGPGRLLVAAPGLRDPNFVRGVILVVEHGDEGTLGVVLNRPTDLDAREPLPSWAPFVRQPDRVFIGGPVFPEMAIGIVRVSTSLDHPSWMPVTESLGLVDLSIEPHEYGSSVTEVRIFSGYSGWAQGQLESELSEPAWFVIDGRPGDAFTRQPEGLWREVLRRQRGTLAMYSTYPPDPTAN